MVGDQCRQQLQKNTGLAGPIGGEGGEGWSGSGRGAGSQYLRLLKAIVISACLDGGGGWEKRTNLCVANDRKHAEASAAVTATSTYQNQTNMATSSPSTTKSRDIKARLTSGQNSEWGNNLE